MTTYTVLPQDDSNLEITLTEDQDLVTLSITPAAVNVTSAVTTVNGLTGDVTLTTSNIAEGSNLYYTDARADARVDLQTGANLDLSFKTTTDLTEGDNLYYTDERVNTFLTDGSVTSINFDNNTSLSWNADDGTLEFPVNGGVTLQIGQENLIHVKNVSGVDLTNGQVVRVTGASGSKLTVDLANNTSDAVSADTIAVMTQDLNNNAVGYATTEGLVRGLDTSTYTEGAVLWLDGAGVFTETKPLTPLHLVQVGYVVRSHPTEGSIFVSIKNGWELEELHDVLITNVANNDLIAWDSANSYWKNITNNYATTAYVDQAEADAVASANGYTDTQVAATLSSANSYTDTAINNLIDGAPAALDTLNEIAAAINDDANYAATIAAQLATKAATTYVDSQDTATLNSANSYTDTREAAITTAYEQYADAGDAQTYSDALADANAYTDTAVATIDGGTF